MTVIDDNYTGHVEPRTAARRTLPGASIVKVSVGPMDNNAYLVTCSQTGETLLIDAANDAEILLELIKRYAPKLSLIVTSHQHQDHWLALDAVAKATGVPTAAHQLDSEPLPVKPDRLLANGDTIKIGQLSFDVIHLRGHTPDPSRWRSMAPTRRLGPPTCSPVTACSPVVLGGQRNRRSSTRSSTTSPPGCSTSTPTPQWSTPGTVTTRRWVPSVPISKSGANDGGEQRGVTTALLPGDLAILGGDVAMIVGTRTMIEARCQ